VINLGTKKHKDKYFEGIDSLEYPGCFAMTELHHGNLFYPYYFVTFSLCF
jgi:acyl-CoA oxidase